MIFRSPSRSIWKHVQSRCNQMGAFVTLKWIEWSSSSEPYRDPTTSALLSTSSDEPVQSSCMTKAFTHFVAPTKSTSRMFAEIKEGDCIMDFVIPLVQILTPGNTNFAVGQIVDLFAFGAANRALASGQTLATKGSHEIQINSLPNPSVIMYKCKEDWQDNVLGETWVQQFIGTELARSWESEYNGKLLGQAILLRKAT